MEIIIYQAHIFIQTPKTTEANFHLPTGPLNFYFHLLESNICLPLAIGSVLFLYPINGQCYVCFVDHCFAGMAAVSLLFPLNHQGFERRVCFLYPYVDRVSYSTNSHHFNYTSEARNQSCPSNGIVSQVLVEYMYMSTECWLTYQLTLGQYVDCQVTLG